MPYATQHKRSKQRTAQKRHRTGNSIPCPCSLCLNRVHLDGNDVNRHVALYGLAHAGPTSSSVMENPEKEASLSASSIISEDHKTDSSAISPLLALPNDETGGISYSSPILARGHCEVNDHDETSDISSETRVKEEPNRTHFTPGSASDSTSLSPEANITTGEDADHDHDNSSVSSVTERSSFSLEKDFVASSEGSNGSSDILESEEQLKDLPDYLRETTEEEELYNSDKAKLPLFDGSSVTVLQALCGYLAWFSEHPGTSKTSLSDLLRLHHEQILPTGNNLPGSYDEAYAFVKPFLLPFVVYDVCPNDCVLFRKTDHYDYSKLTECPSPKCNGSRYTANRSAARKFYYYPLGPRWKRMYGSATIAEVLQSHNCDMHPTVNVNDIIGSKSWCEAYSPQGVFNGEKRGVSAQLSTDGVNPFSSNKVIYSMWPIMLTVLNLPKRIRNLFSNMMLVGIIPGNGNQEPKNLNPFLEVVVDELLSLSGSTFYDGYRKAPFEFKVQLLSYVLDYPGLNKVFLSTGANALQGCMWCDMRGKHVASLDKVVYLENRRFLPEDHELRRQSNDFPDKEVERRPPPEQLSNSDIKWNSIAHARAKNPTQAANVAKATGSKGCHCFMLLDEFDRTEQVFPDMMHVLKNVIVEFHSLFIGLTDTVKLRNTEKRLGRFGDACNVNVPDNGATEEDLNAKGKKRTKEAGIKGTKKTKVKLPNAPFRLTEEEIRKADSRAKTVRVPSGYGWTPKPFFGRKSYIKSHDWKQIAVDGILKFCLRGLLGQQQRTTFFKFLDLIALLCKDSISADDISTLKEKVNVTLALLERDFPITVQTISVHLLHHVVQGIQQQGPTHSWSMYVYERFNSWICQRVMNRLHPEATVMETYRIFDWVQFMRLTGRFSEDERHKYILIDGAEHTSATCSQSQDYQPSHAELSICKEVFKHRSVEGSEQIMYTSAKKLFSKARRNGFTGKLEVCRGHVAESAKTVSSLVKISAGDYLGRIAQIRHFLDFEVAEKAIEIAIVTLFTNEVQTDVDCGLSWVDTSNKENKAFLLEDISRPLVTATDDSAGHVLWLLNFDSV